MRSSFKQEMIRKPVCHCGTKVKVGYTHVSLLDDSAKTIQILSGQYIHLSRMGGHMIFHHMTLTSIGVLYFSGCTSLLCLMTIKQIILKTESRRYMTMSGEP